MLQSNIIAQCLFFYSNSSNIVEQLHWPHKKLFIYVLRRKLELKSVELSFDSPKHFVLYYLFIKL